MALFGNKKETKDKKASTGVEVSGMRVDLTHVLVAPRITEKATNSAMQDAYVFNVDKRTTKREIIKAMQEFHKVTPIKVNVVNYPTKKKRNARTGKVGTKQGGKKAYVYLKKGENINII